MKTKALAVRSILEMTEKRANRRQVSGHSRSWFAGARSHAGTRPQAASNDCSLVVPAGRCLMLILILIPIFILGLPAALRAQSQNQWSDLKGLRVGQGIEVIESSMKNHGGTFVALSDEEIILREKNSDVSMKRENVVRVSTTSGARRGEHAVIGLVVGGVVGAGIGAASFEKGAYIGKWRGVGALVGVAIGAPSGAAVGICFPAHATIYRAAPAVVSHPGTFRPTGTYFAPPQPLPFTLLLLTSSRSH
jgi:hypothetical protein